MGRRIDLSLTLARILCLALALIAPGAARAAAPVRVALLIANGNYPSKPDRLTGPINDAVLLRTALAKTGFAGIDGDASPTLLTDASRERTREALLAFRQTLAEAGNQGLGVLYYAGHGGADARGSDNFLIPADVRDIASADVATQGLGLRSVLEMLAQIDGPGRPAIAIVVDACRTPPSSQAAGTRGGAPTRPMVQPDNQLPAGMAVMLSTAAGQPAPDRSIFAEVLADKIQSEQHAPLANLLDEVMRAVAEKSGKAQRPVYQSQVMGRVCLADCQDAAGLAELKANLACQSARAEDLVLTIRARDAAKVAAILRCRRELLVSYDVRSAFSAAFQETQFAEASGFLGRLRQSGLRFLSDFAPTASTGKAGSSPLKTALLDGNLPAVQFLLDGDDRAALSGYPKLMVSLLPGLMEDDATTQTRRLEAATLLVRAGLPVVEDDHAAFRLAMRGWLQTQITAEDKALVAGGASLIWGRLFSDARPPAQAEVWLRLTRLLAPSDGVARQRLASRVTQEFVKPRVDEFNGLSTLLRDMLRNSGLRTIEDPSAPLGGRNIEVSADELRDDDLVLDGDRLLGVSGWAGVGQVRSRLQALDDARLRWGRLAQRSQNMVAP